MPWTRMEPEANRSRTRHCLVYFGLSEIRKRKFWVMFKVWHPLWITAALLCTATALPAQSVRVNDLGIGKLLVAHRDLPDPRFAETVILLVQHDERGAVGLVINRKTKVPISRALRQLKGAKDWSEPVYLGGPVKMAGVLALLWSHAEQDEMKSVLSEIYLVSSKRLLEKILAEGPTSAELQVYLGYSGWRAGQLENEVKLGSWYIFDGSAGLVFDFDPASLWARLTARTEQQLAGVRTPVWMALMASQRAAPTDLKSNYR